MTTSFTPAQDEVISIPLPLEKDSYVKSEDCRVWIGNMDSSLTEYSLLQLLRRCGKIKDLDFLFHKSGPLQGQCRGFSFATFYCKEDAENTIKALNGKLVLSRRLQVRWAHEQQDDRKSVPVSLNLSSDIIHSSKSSSSTCGSHSKLTMIKSIEQKLKDMEKKETKLSVNIQPPPSMHPLLKQSKAKAAALEARKQAYPYRKHFKKRR